MSNNLDPVADFDSGIVSFPSIDAAQRDPMWVDTGILNYDLSTSTPPTFTVLYQDGGVLSIPLGVMWFESMGSGAGTVFMVRRHTDSGRLVPFQAAQNDPRLRDAQLRTLPGPIALQRAVPLRFDTRLTPSIIAFLNETQTIYMATGFLRVFELHLLNPLAFGWSAAAAPTTSVRAALGRLAVRRTVRVAPAAATVGQRLVGEVSALGGTSLQRYLEFARRLSSVRTLSPTAKADLLVSAARRFGLEIGGQATVTGGRILVLAKDGKTAFQVALDGQITFGRFNAATLDIVNPTVIRPLGGP